jgi:hypothetical protein
VKNVLGRRPIEARCAQVDPVETVTKYLSDPLQGVPVDNPEGVECGQQSCRVPGTFSSLAARKILPGKCFDGRGENAMRERLFSLSECQHHQPFRSFQEQGLQKPAIRIPAGKVAAERIRPPRFCRP